MFKPPIERGQLLYYYYYYLRYTYLLAETRSLRQICVRQIKEFIEPIDKHIVVAQHDESLVCTHVETNGIFASRSMEQNVPLGESLDVVIANDDCRRDRGGFHGSGKTPTCTEK